MRFLCERSFFRNGFLTRAGSVVESSDFNSDWLPLDAAAQAALAKAGIKREIVTGYSDVAPAPTEPKKKTPASKRQPY